MMPRLSARDEQTLSDYLDGQLSERDAAAFEKRLKENEKLREAADDLRRLKAVLRGAPRYRLPRNFTLTPAMVKKTTPGWVNFWLPAMRFTSAMAVFLLIAVYVFEFLPGGIPALRTSQAFAPSESSPPEEASIPGPPMQSMPDMDHGWGGAGGGGGAPAAAEPPLTSSMETPAVNDGALPAEKQQDTLTQPTGEAQALMAAPAPALIPAVPTSPEVTPETGQAFPPGELSAEGTHSGVLPFAQPGEAPAAEEGAPGNQGVEAAPTAGGENDDAHTNPVLVPTDERGTISTPEALAKAAPPMPGNSGLQKGSLWTWIKLALALTALATATAAVLIQRKAKK